MKFLLFPGSIAVVVADSKESDAPHQLPHIRDASQHLIEKMVSVPLTLETSTFFGLWMLAFFDLLQPTEEQWANAIMIVRALLGNPADRPTQLSAICARRLVEKARQLSYVHADDIQAIDARLYPTFHAGGHGSAPTSVPI